MRKWRQELHERLRGMSAPRILSFNELWKIANTVKEDIEVRSVRRFVMEAETSGAFRRVRKGLWINDNAIPTPSVAEAAAHVRKDAVVSLQTVLGDAGILNNFSSQVYAVLPVDPATRPNTGSVKTAVTTFHFRGIDREVIEAGAETDRFVPFLTYRRATPEAALVHWIHLANTRLSTMTMPDTQCDVSHLDMDRLERLSEAAGVRAEVFAFVDACRNREKLDDSQAGWVF